MERTGWLFSRPFSSWPCAVAWHVLHVRRRRALLGMRSPSALCSIPVRAARTAKPVVDGASHQCPQQDLAFRDRRPQGEP